LLEASGRVGGGQLFKLIVNLLSRLREFFLATATELWTLAESSVLPHEKLATKNGALWGSPWFLLRTGSGCTFR